MRRKWRERGLLRVFFSTSGGFECRLVPRKGKGGEGGMVKEMKLDLRPWSLQHHHYSCVKLLVCVLLIGLSVRLLLFSSWVIWPFWQPETKPSGNEKCDLFDGEWVPDLAGPAYTNSSCLTIEGHQNCMFNGRPDTGYLYWKWKPKGCDIPLFDAERFLNGMRNKWWAFIGDSISRNHIQSLLCLLSQVENPMDVFHDKEWRSRRWYFSSYNFTLSVIWSPFLVKADIFEDMDGVSSKEIQLHLDVLHEEWTSQLKNFDYVITSGGKWFLKSTIFYEKNKIVGCHYCPSKNLTELGYDYGYRKALKLALRHIASSGFKGTILFRTSTPDHFENGEWSEGGSCKRTQPFKEGEVTLKEVEKVMREVELEAFNQVVVQARKHRVDLRLFDTTYLSLLRPDGHPGPYRIYQPFAQDKNAKVQYDCLHWCLPGPIDRWNDLLMKIFLNHRR